MKKIRLLKPVLVCLMVATTLSGCNKRAGLQIGDTIPKITLTDFQGKSLTLPDDINGKVALVRFWSIDCDFCNKEILLALEPLYQKYKSQGFVPLAINESRVNKTDERLKKFEQLTYPMLTDNHGLIARQFGVIGLPTTFIIDQQGIVRDKLTGEAGINEFEKLFTTVLYQGKHNANSH